MKKISVFLLTLVICTSYLFGQDNNSKPIVQLPVYFDISPPLRDMIKNPPPKAETSWKDGIVKNRFDVKPRPTGQAPGGLSDPGLQTMDGSVKSDTTIVNFEGNSNTQGYSPPDTHGDVGPNHYFQVVNCHYSIYNKTGGLLLGPLANSSIFSGMTNNSNDGDAVVLYDEQADRWVFSQFSLPSYPSGPFYQMIAVSTTPDPTGTWYRYQYSFTNMPDYPKFGVWGDGYYMSMHIFTSGSGSYAGIGAVAYNRTLMLTGSPAATMVMFTRPSSDEAFGWLPSDCDGPFPAGNPPNYFLYTYDGSSNDHIGIYEFHVDWVTTANSTFTNFLSLPVNAFTTNITGIVQKGTTIKPDPLDDRMMYRLQYRSFAGYSTMVCNHTVDISSTVAGIRWYELRKTTGSWSIYQQGTYSVADDNSRWTGSIAMDSSGNIALGYSVSGTNTYPSIRYTGRKKNDALGQMTLAEKRIVNGGGSQTATGRSRWGDYSAISCDPSAKATFWYTQMYYASSSADGWKTRIASFSFALPPYVSTMAASAVSVTAATINGSVNPNNQATNYYFEWGTTVAYGNTTSTTSAGSGNTAVAVSANLTGLISGTTYHFRVVAINPDGTSNGNDLSFTAGGAVVTTTAITSVTSNSAVSGGNVVMDGGLSVTARGVCWGLTPNPTVSGNHTTDGSGTGTFVSSITGLASTTLYHVRAYATNSTGTYYGDDQTCTTLCGAISSFPWNEGFEGGDIIPNCWTQEQVSSSGLNWSFLTGNGGSNPATAHGGTYNACLKDVTSADNKTMLITPRINLTLVSSPQLKFWHTQEVYTGNQDQLDVYYKTSLAGTWTLLASYTASVATWTQRTITLPNATNDYYIAFQGNAKNGRGVCIDDVQVSSSCSRTYPVSVSISTPANPVCEGTGVTFTAVPINGGTTPAYQWKVNGGLVSGATNVTYSFSPAANDFVNCILTSNATCTVGNPSTSNTVTMTVNPSLPVSVSLDPSANPVCAGTSVTFTPTPVNGGTPTYQWFKNTVAVGTDPTYTCVPADGDHVYVVMTSTLTCKTGSPATSNTVIMTVNQVLPVSVSIEPSANAVCAGTSVTFTPTPVNGGTPTYQWFKNTVAVGTDATYTDVPVDGDQVYAVMTSTLPCGTGSPATSNTVAMTVNPVLALTNAIATLQTSVCEGAGVTITCDHNYPVSSCDWYVNGVIVSHEMSLTYVPANADEIYCICWTTPGGCWLTPSATSNTITMTVNPVYPVSISISPSANPVDAGTPVTFTAVGTNGGASPHYQWKVNAINAGTDNAVFTYTPVNGDAVLCVLTSGELCTSTNPATSNTIDMIVNTAVPLTLSLQNHTVTGTQCFNATQTILVAGDGNLFTVQNGGSATMIAGENILYYPGTVVEAGGYMFGYIVAPEGPWCIPGKVFTGTTPANEITLDPGQQYYRIYPNPTTGTFTLEVKSSGTKEKLLVEIYDMKGQKMISDEMSDVQKQEFSLAGKPAGIYLIRVIGEMNTGTTRIIKQ